MYCKQEFACSATWLFKPSHCGYRERLYASEQPKDTNMFLMNNTRSFKQLDQATGKKVF